MTTPEFDYKAMIQTDREDKVKKNYDSTFLE